MPQRTSVTLGVPAHQLAGLGRRRDLLSDIPDHTDRDRRPIGQESPQEPDRPHLHPEPDPIVIATVHLHPPQVRIGQEEEPLQLSPAGFPVELAIHRSLLIAQELHRHKINLVELPDRLSLAPDPVPLRLRP